MNRIIAEPDTSPPLLTLTQVPTSFIRTRCHTLHLTLTPPMATDKNIQKLVDAVLAIEAEEAAEAGQLGFMCRATSAGTLKHLSDVGS